MLFIALSRPQWGIAQRSSRPTGIDLIIALDVSKSMLARDIRPNRLERVKLTISNLIGNLKGDRIGLIAFAGNAFLQCPLTLDHQAFINTLNNIEIGTIKAGGTNLASPIDEASRSFSKDDRDKFLILISDGEDLEGEGLKRAKEAAEQGIKIYSIGIGSIEGARIPTDPIDSPARNFLLDPSGKTVITQLDEIALKKISQETDGQYYPIGSTGQGLESVFKKLKSLGEQKTREQLSTEIPIERFQPFIILAILAFLIEKITPSNQRRLSRSMSIGLALLISFFGGCIKQDNIKRAELAAESGDWSQAAKFYDIELNATYKESPQTSPKILLNSGLAHSKAGHLNLAKERLLEAIDQSLDSPKIQSKALNELGNIFYKETNGWLDQQNIMQARKSWKQALKHYGLAAEIDGNIKATSNLKSLTEQIEKRISSMICIIKGKIWRDLNGDGIPQKSEQNLQGKIFWDKNDDGEHNASNEPSLKTNLEGQFAFEWISSDYPVSLSLDSELIDGNQTDKEFLIPIFPAPPPPLNKSMVRNLSFTVEKAGESSVLIPYRQAPIIKGKVWSDLNGDSNPDNNEDGFSQAKLFLDQNGNFLMDENETSFSPDSNGTFAFPIAPGQYSVCILPDNPDANITFPIEEKKGYLTWVDFESTSDPLIFGIQDNTESQDNNQSQPQQSRSDNNQESQENNSEKNEQIRPEEVNALYERLLQEMESKSKNLDDENQKIIGTIPQGRDY